MSDMRAIKENTHKNILFNVSDNPEKSEYQIPFIRIALVSMTKNKWMYIENNAKPYMSNSGYLLLISNGELV